MLRRLALLTTVLTACSAPTYSHAPTAEGYRPLPGASSLRDTGPQRARLGAAEQRMRQGIAPGGALLRDAVEQIVSELGQACVPSNPGGDGMHWTIGCATETLFGAGLSTPSTPAMAQRWRAVGQVLAGLLRRQIPANTRLRLAVSGFADHIQFVSQATVRCDDAQRFWNAQWPEVTDETSRNRALSFCRAAQMAREIACAMVTGPCARESVARIPGLSVGVFGGGTTRLDESPSHFLTRVPTATGELSCACQAIPRDQFGPRWTTLHGTASADATCPVPNGAEPTMFDCDGARRVELDLWLEVTAQSTAQSGCIEPDRDPDAHALVCLQDAIGRTSHEGRLRGADPVAPEDRCRGAATPAGWTAATLGDRAPCVAELGR